MISLDEKKTNEMLDLLNIYTPLRDEVVIEIPSEDDLKNMKTGAGIIIGGKVAKEEYMYTILAAGPECKRVKIGDKVIIRSSIPLPIMVINKMRLSQIGEFHILGIIKQ